MSKVEATETVSGQFQASAAEVEAIFDSYRELHSIYANSFKKLESELGGLPAQYKQKVGNTKKVFENVRGTVDGRQLEISSQLYGQGLVLLVGIAEAITKEMFRNLLVRNIRKVTIKRNINLPIDKVLKAITDEQLAGLVLEVLESEGNPAEKLNFQNMKQLQGVMKGYLDVNLGDELMSELHEYWQVRHVIIHNASIVDQQLIDNLKKARISTEKYVVGEKVEVVKADYDKCFALLALLFEAFDAEIERLKLSYNR